MTTRSMPVEESNAWGRGAWDAGPMRFIVYGAGGIGGVVGARLHQGGHDIALIARGEHFEAIEARGLVLETPEGSTRLNIPVVDHPEQAGVAEGDVVLLTMKSQHTGTAIETLANHASPETPVVCMQNGVSNERTALRRFPSVYGVAVMAPVGFLERGVVQAYSTPVTGILDIGRYPVGSDDTASRIATAFSQSGFVSETRTDIMRWKYRKLVTNLSNAVEAICGPEGRRGRIEELATTEGERVLEAAGVEVASAEEDRERRGNLLTLGPVAGQPRPGSSVWQSLTRAIGSVETDYLNGEIVLLGRLHGIPTPVNELLQTLTRQMAAAHTPPGRISEAELLQMLASQQQSDST
ncbi:MAG TPA: 2-dehydropantoate 2-reductase [Acidimicrobiia bacterium]|nr:2-dehydropantoate 2-reductase [Acidimicrobiia bacterium]